MIAELMNNHRGKNNLKSMDETLKMLKRAVFRIILVVDCDSAILEPFLRHAKKIIGDGFRAKSCNCNARYLDILGVEIFGNYLHVDKLELRESSEQFIKDVFSHSEDKMLPSLPKEIHLGELHMQDEEALQFNGLLDAADRLTLIISPHSHGNFCQSWFNVSHWIKIFRIDQNLNISN
uniref:Uncharacterized protein n=1 Tax=Acrobeloides nanus TaxID=290746 RepID=A0A914D9I0_9BILA